MKFDIIIISIFKNFKYNKNFYNKFLLILLITYLLT